MRFYILAKQDNTPKPEYRICISIDTYDILGWQRIDWLKDSDIPLAFDIFKAKTLIKEQKDLDNTTWHYWLEPVKEFNSYLITVHKDERGINENVSK